MIKTFKLQESTNLEMTNRLIVSPPGYLFIYSGVCRYEYGMFLKGRVKFGDYLNRIHKKALQKASGF